MAHNHLRGALLLLSLFGQAAAPRQVSRGADELLGLLKESEEESRLLYRRSSKVGPSAMDDDAILVLTYPRTASTFMWTALCIMLQLANHKPVYQLSRRQHHAETHPAA